MSEKGSYNLVWRGDGKTEVTKVTLQSTSKDFLGRVHY